MEDGKYSRAILSELKGNFVKIKVVTNKTNVEMYLFMENIILCCVHQKFLNTKCIVQ